MLRRSAITLILCALLAAPAAAAAKPVAATVGVPVVEKVRVVDVEPVTSGPALPHQGRVLVRVTVRFPALGQPAPGLRSVGTVSTILSRFTGDRDFAIAGGTAARALPVTTGPLDVVFQIALNPAQSAKARSASSAGVLRALISVDQRANAFGRAPASNGAFEPRSLTVVAAIPPETTATPPLLVNDGASVAIDVNPAGDAIVLGATVPLGGGLRLHLDTGGIRQNGLVPAGGGDGSLKGSATVVNRNGTELARGPVAAGLVLLRVGTTGLQRGRLVIGAMTIGAYAIPAQTIVLSPPSTRRSG